MGSSLSLKSCPVDSKIKKGFLGTRSSSKLWSNNCKTGLGIRAWTQGRCDGMVLPSAACPVFFFFSSDSIFEQDPKTNRAQSETPFFRHLEGFAWPFQVVMKSEPFPG